MARGRPGAIRHTLPAAGARCLARSGPETGLITVFPGGGSPLRLPLCELTARILGNGLVLLDIMRPERM